MFKSRLGFFGIALPLYDDLSDGSGGGAPQNDGQAPAAASDAPTAIDVSDDTLIRVKGSDKPVKFGEHARGFQSQFTRASQEAARFKRELEQERATRARFEQEQRRSQQPQGQPQDPYAEVETLPYLTGQQAANLLRQQGKASYERDQVLVAALRKMQAMESTLQRLNTTHVSGAFDGKIQKWLVDGGYPPEAADLAKEIYLAYEGDNLDEEFPQLFAKRFEQIERIVEGRRMAKIRAARPQPFIPGRGGQASPSKPLEIKADASPKEMADQLFNLFGESGT